MDYRLGAKIKSDRVNFTSFFKLFERARALRTSNNDPALIALTPSLLELSKRRHNINKLIKRYSNYTML